ncbi:MAG: type II toxin-antitoxin system Phd/YefM family antitoxin [Terriglobales bacterium]
MTETSYARLHRSLDRILDRVTSDHEIVTIRRKNGKNVAIVDAHVLTGLMETVYLLRSPRNARRLLTALHRATAQKGKPEQLDQFRKKSSR